MKVFVVKISRIEQIPREPRNYHPSKLIRYTVYGISSSSLYHYIQHTYSLNYVALENLLSCSFLPHVMLHAAKIIVCVHAIFSTYMDSRLIMFEKELFARYCQSPVGKLTFSDRVS